MSRLSKLSWRLLLGLLIVQAMLIYYPVRSGFTRTAILAVPVAIVACLVVALWRHKRLRWLPLIPPVLLAILLLLPGRDSDPARLRAAYIEDLQRYDGIRYVWGGEGFRGVDCSGFVRTALVDAHLREAIRTMNPALARRGIAIWWQDASAREMGDAADGSRTQRLGQDIKLRDASQMLQPGDLGVTADGSHVLAYLGEGRWIQADPIALKVMPLEPGAASDWWNVKIIPCGWRCLAR